MSNLETAYGPVRYWMLTGEIAQIYGRIQFEGEDYKHVLLAHFEYTNGVWEGSTRVAGVCSKRQAEIGKELRELWSNYVTEDMRLAANQALAEEAAGGRAAAEAVQQEAFNRLSRAKAEVAKAQAAYDEATRVVESFW